MSLINKMEKTNLNKREYNPPKLEQNQMRIAKNMINAYLKNHFELIDRTNYKNHEWYFFSQPNLSLSYHSIHALRSLETFEIKFIEFGNRILNKHLEKIEEIVKSAEEIDEKEAYNLTYIESIKI